MKGSSATGRTPLTDALVAEVVELCQRAGQAILPFFQAADVQVAYKPDSSPVTAADLAAHQVLVAGLKRVLDVPVLSEESEAPPFHVRQLWERYWLIDPLDGTKEFISGSGEFTVNVALIEQGRAVVGVVHAPAFGTTYTGYSGRHGHAAYKQHGDQRWQIHARSLSARRQAGLPLAIVASRRHRTPSTDAVIERLATHFDGCDTTSVGSSLKFCLIAEGVADYYPRHGPTCEWDTAAAQAVVEASGGAVLDENFQPLLYNQKNNLLNPNFHVVGDPNLPWSTLIGD